MEMECSQYIIYPEVQVQIAFLPKERQAVVKLLDHA